MTILLEYPEDFSEKDIQQLREVDLHPRRKHFAVPNLRVQMLVADRPSCPFKLLHTLLE